MKQPEPLGVRMVVTGSELVSDGGWTAQ